MEAVVAGNTHLPWQAADKKLEIVENRLMLPQQAAGKTLEAVENGLVSPADTPSFGMLMVDSNDFAAATDKEDVPLKEMELANG